MMIDFLKYRVACFALSVVFVALGVVGYVHNGGFCYSVDFTGGTQVLFKFNQPIGSETLKSILAKEGWDDAVLREFNTQEFVVRTKDFANDAQGLAQKMGGAIEKHIPGMTATIAEANAVGAGVGTTLRWNTIVGVLIALLLMFIYIGVRFWSLSYGLGAVIALLHDPLVVLAVFALFKLEISPTLVSALIAVLGYSINDTIVIFARIRENFAHAKGENPVALVNRSINETLTRTLLTSFATTLVVLSMLIFGGESLRTLSIALLIGIVVGTYSSIYVASPVMLLFRKES